MEDDLSARIIVASPEAFAATAAAYLAQALRERASAADGLVSLGLSGGSTPGPVYERLARAGDVPWDRVAVYFADERAVPPDDPHSNHRLACEHLLSRVPVTEERVHRMEAERDDREAAADAYAALLPTRLDVLVLGIGEDGHTASLFPGHPALPDDGADADAKDGVFADAGDARGAAGDVGGTRAVARRALAVEAPPPHAPRGRLTLAPATIREARDRVVLAAGARKAEAVHRALEAEGPVRDVPARLVRDGTWIVDRDAAGGLDRRA